MSCCSSKAIRSSKEWKCVGKKACAMPWCHGPGSFEVKTSRFAGTFQDSRSDCVVMIVLTVQ